MSTRTAQANVVQLLAPGSCFAYDTGGVDDGDVLSGEVIDVVPRFPPNADVVGHGAGGYRVRLYCGQDPEQGTPEGVEDLYAWDFLGKRFVRLTSAQMERARRAGWPSGRGFLEKELGHVFPHSP